MQENRQEKSLIKQKILLYLTKKGISTYKFYKDSGITRGVLSQNNGITEDNLARFLAYAPDINADWLLTGHGEMLKPNVPDGAALIDSDPDGQSTFSGKDTNKNSSKQGKRGENSSGQQKVSFVIGQGTPYYDVDFIGGFSEIINDQTTVPTCNIIVPGFEKATVWCNVTGHSMEPKINHGDIIALRECTINDIQYGEIYAVVLDSFRTIKILRRGTTPDVLRYVPINPDFDDQEFQLSRITHIFEVLGSIARFF